MSLATILSRAQNGLQADLVRVEVHLAPGLPGLSIVGLPEAAVRESRDRVRAAIANAGYRFPNRRITVNLAPADLPKEGGRFDLPIALGVLAASAQIPVDALDGVEVLGELSLGGTVRAVRGALPAALRCAEMGHRLLVPPGNIAEAQLARTIQVHPAETLSSVGSALHAGGLPEVGEDGDADPRSPLAVEDLREVRGQTQARRALEVAAAGGHSLLLIGPPGSGKSMLAARLPGILPPLTHAEAIEVAAVASVADGTVDPARWGQRPFRHPHHTASAAALVGGGSQPRPGEITRAHHGALFLDELPEFDRNVLEVLREPLERGRITISRAARQTEFPAAFQLVAAMNPCPCGYLGDAGGRCRCTPDQVARYRGKLSGPLLDRIDLQVFVPPVDRAVLTAPASDAEDSATVRARVIAARDRQQRRQARANAVLDPGELDQACPRTPAAQSLLDAALTRLALSARGYHRVLRVARTIADLAASDEIGSTHIAEAIRYRELERGLA